MMRTRTIATGAGITGSADCPPAFPRSSSLVPLGLWCCAVSSPVAAPGLTRTYMRGAYILCHIRRHTDTLTRPICSGLARPLFGPR